MNSQITVDSSKVAEKLLNKYANEVWNNTVQEARIQTLEDSIKKLKEENASLKQKLSVSSKENEKVVE